MYLDKNPYEELGNLKAVVKSNLMILHSNMEIDNIGFSYCGGHGLVGSDDSEENIKINNCIIENIGGSYLHKNGDTRFGNGIEFYGCNAKNILVKDNIFRNIYDVGFTVQGAKGSGNNIDVCNNIFINNTQDSEIWENGSATGIVNYTFHNNISINQGRGWGYEARPDKYAAGHILFWGYNIKNTDISFDNNLVYNPRRLYFIEQTNGTNIFFKQNDYIKSNNNTYFMAEDSTIFRDSYKISEKNLFIEEYNKDKNSVFNSLVVDENITKISNISNDINEIRRLFEKEHQYDEGKITKEATYETEGEKIYTCKICGNTKTEVIAKLNKNDENQKNDEDQKNDENNDSKGNINNDDDKKEDDKNNNNEQQITNNIEENNNEQQIIDNDTEKNINEQLNENTNKIDNTCSTNKLPKTGKRSSVIIWITIIILLMIIVSFYKKYRIIKTKME